MSSESRFGSAPQESAPCPGLYLLPLDDSFYPPKRIPLYVNNSGTGNTGTGTGPRVRIGRQLNQKAAPGEANGVFESRVLSRQHAEVWVEDGRILIRDVKSSNGTFVNGERLSAEGQESEPFELRSDDILEFGIDIVGEHGEVMHRKVAARVTCALTPADAQRAIRAEQRVYPPRPPSPPNANANSSKSALDAAFSAQINPGSINLHIGAPSSASVSTASASASGTAPPLFAPPVPGANPTSISALSSSSGGAGARRPQHAAGLAGMGGMGAERIRPRSGVGAGGVDFDSILARLRDGVRLGPGLGVEAHEYEHGQAHDAPPLGAAITGIGTPASVPAPPPPPLSVLQGSSHADTDGADSQRGLAPQGPEDGEALARLRAELAETQAALERLPALPGLAGSASDTSSSAADSDSAALLAPAQGSSAHGEKGEAKADADGGSPLYVNAHALRAALGALREEVGALQRERQASRGGMGMGTQARSKGKGKESEKKNGGKGRERRVDFGAGGERLWWERDEGEEHDNDAEGEGAGRGKETEDEGEREELEDWITDLEIEGALPPPVPTPAALRDVNADDDGEDGVKSPTTARVKRSTFSTGRDPAAGEATKEHAVAPADNDKEPGAAAALHAQLDALGAQLATLHAQLGALQAPPRGLGLSALVGRVERLEADATSSASAVSSDAQAREAQGREREEKEKEKEKQAKAAREQEEVKAALRAGLAALQAEWGAFRAEAGAFTLAAPFGGVYPSTMASASASESSSFVSRAHGTWTPPASETRRRKNRTRGRNSVPDAAYEAHIAAANPDELELSSDEEDEEVGKAGGGREARASAPTAAHGRESSDEARVPGRWPWGLLTPAGSVAVRAAGNVSHAASWPGSASTSPAVRSNGNGRNSAHAHLQLSKGPAGGTGAMHDEPNALLLAGAVGVGAMLVAAAWWGA